MEKRSTEAICTQLVRPLLMTKKTQRELWYPTQAQKTGLNGAPNVRCRSSRCEWSLVAGVRGIAKFQRGVLELESGQDRFVVLGVGQLSFHVVSSFDDLCRNGFGQVA